MTSKLTRERLAEIAQFGFSSAITPANDFEIKELARLALAEMDCEPAALQPELAKVIYHFRDWNEGFPVERFKADYVISWMLANYPPAQPAPVVPEEVTAEDCPALVKYDVTEVDEAWARGFNSCRAAMLQAYPVCTCPSGDGSLRWPCPVHPGNSPAQSDCCPAQNGVNPEQKSLTPAQDGNHLVIPDGYVMVPEEPTESMVIAGFESEPDEFFSESEVWEAYQKMSGCEQAAFRARLCWRAMLAAAQQEVPDGK